MALVCWALVWRLAGCDDSWLYHQADDGRLGGYHNEDMQRMSKDEYREYQE